MADYSMTLRYKVQTLLRLAVRPYIAEQWTGKLALVGFGHHILAQPLRHVLGMGHRASMPLVSTACISAIRSKMPASCERAASISVSAHRKPRKTGDFPDI